MIDANELRRRELLAGAAKCWPARLNDVPSGDLARFLFVLKHEEEILRRVPDMARSRNLRVDQAIELVVDIMLGLKKHEVSRETSANRALLALVLAQRAR